MYSLIEHLGIRIVMRREFVPFLLAFTVAEFFYKFKSFALECIAFLLTWYILSLAQSWIVDQSRQ